MDECGELVGEDLLRAVELAALPLIHLVDLLERQECEHTDALQNILIAHVAPVLVEVVGRGLVRVEPHRAARGLAHLLALGIKKQRDRHRLRVLAELAANELRAAEHVGPLVVAAELHVAAVLLEHVVEVVGLHDHVVEFQERKALFHALLIALGAQHVVHREARAHLAQQLDVVELHQPVGVVEHHGLALAEVDEALHLALEALSIVVDVGLGEHLAHIVATRGVSDHGRAAADERNGLVARHLESFHQAQRHEVADVQAIRRAVKADVERRLAVVDEVADLLLVRHLRDQAARLELFINSHLLIPPVFLFYFISDILRRFRIAKNALCPFGQRANKFAVPPLVRRFLAKTASRSADTLPRDNGRSRGAPTGKLSFGRRLRGVFRHVSSPSCTGRRLSAQEIAAYFSASSP